jgi:hypothetical protein
MKTCNECANKDVELDWCHYAGVPLDENDERAGSCENCEKRAEK